MPGWTRSRRLNENSRMLPSQRALFDIPREVCFLNAASWSPLPRATIEAGRRAVGRKGQPWLIDQEFAANQYERARRAAARLIHADAEDIALIASVGYGVAVAAKVLSVPPGSRVLVLQDDHSSPVLEWMTRAGEGGFTVETVRSAGAGDWTQWLLAAIERPGAAPIAVVSISSVHWSDGGTVALDVVVPAVRTRGAALLIDATHSVGIVDLDVRALDPDFVVFPTYKWLLGPYGRAFLYVAKRHQGGIPLEQTSYGRRAALRYGRARPFCLNGDGLDRHGVGRGLGFAGDCRTAGDADHATGRRAARRNRDDSQCTRESAPYSEPRLPRWNAAGIDPKAGSRERARGAAARPDAHQPACLQ